jgi:hypothetical protein
MEVCMKTLKNLRVALVAVSLLAIPQRRRGLAPIVVAVSSAARTVLSRFRTRTRRVTRISPTPAGTTASMKAGRKRASTKPKVTAKNALL